MQIDDSNDWVIYILFIIIGGVLGFVFSILRDEYNKFKDKKKHKEMLIGQLIELKERFSKENPFESEEINGKPLSHDEKAMFTDTHVIDFLERQLIDELTSDEIKAIAKCKSQIYRFKENKISIENKKYRKALMESIDDALALLENCNKGIK